MWVTGSPPKRFQHSGKETINDVVEEVEALKAAEEGPKYTKAVLDVANSMRNGLGKVIKLGGRATGASAGTDQAAAV